MSADAARTTETLPDGTLITDSPVVLPEVLDAVIVGGGPFGTAAAFRAKELGLAALVIDYDDLMKRIRDYAKDKLILPDYGGGDRMLFPKGGELITSLHFPPIDKDRMCVEWKALYRKFNVPAQVGIEMTGLEREGDLWRVLAWNHNTKKEQPFRARHVVMAFGRGVPRRFDIPGNVAGLAFGLTTADRYIGEPACVIGGGTSAAEAVIAISNAKAAAGDTSAVYWSYRGEKMPKVSKALAEVFFDAFVGSGNVRYIPNSEPMAVLDEGDESYLSIRTSRTVTTGRPVETTQLEFKKVFCIACIGEDIPEALLTQIGVPLVTGGASNKKRIVVNPLLETRQPNLYLAGDVLSPAYFETTDFDGDPAAFTEVKRRGNIKAALRDGVLVSEVIAQKLAGRTLIDVHLEFEEGEAAPPPPAAAQPPAAAAASGAAAPSVTSAPSVEDATRLIAKPKPATAESEFRLVSILAGGVEANEYAIKPGGPTRIGRIGADITFAEDTQLADIHASLLPDANGYRIRDEGSAQGVYVQPANGRSVEVDPGTIVRAGRQWLLIGDKRGANTVTHYDAAGRRLGRFDLKDGTSIIGRESPDITVAPEDGSLSRRHVAVTRRDGKLSIKDLGSANGTLVRVGTPMVLANGDRILVGQQILQFTDERETEQPRADVKMETSFMRRQAPAPPPPASTKAAAPAAPAPSAAPAAAAAPVASPPAAAAAADATSPGVFFKALDKMALCQKGQTICEAAEGAGIKLDADCHQGVCGMDPVRVLSGLEHLNAPGATEKNTLEDLCSLEPGEYRLACMARVSGSVAVEIIKQ